MNRPRLRRRAPRRCRSPLLLGKYEAQFVVRVQAREVFPNCPRYIHNYRFVERSRFVPRVGCPTPVPEWKRSEWAKDALPANDPARNGTT
jgi:hypothetical protein